MKRGKRPSIKDRRKIDEAMQFHLLCASQGVVLTIYDVKSDENDYKFLGNLSESAEMGYYTIPQCELLGRPVTLEELMTAKDFAQLIRCRRKYYLGGAKPCIPVFYRGADAFSKFIEKEGAAYELENKG